MSGAVSDSGGAPLERLLEPLRLGPRTAPGRILFGPHCTNLSRANGYSARHAAYYRERAAGGAGVIVLEEACVDPSDRPYEAAIHGFADGIAGGFRLAAAAAQEAGALVVAAIGHSGGQGTSMHTQRPLLAPSPVPEVATREVPQALEARRIPGLVAAYARVAEAARQAGLDGVEVNAGQSSLVRQFLSGLTNLRDDAYGGDRERRLRFAVEVLEAVREALGPELVLGLRLSIDEYAPWAGITPEEGVAIARSLAERVQLDYLVATSGGIFTLHATQPGMHVAAPARPDLAQLLRADGFPAAVFAQGSIVDAAAAAGLVASMTCDGVEMTRALIADPELPRKAAAGGLEAVVPCILCNQDCRVRDLHNRVVGCVQNPRAGHETEAEPSRVPSGRRARVLVVGSGPAGLSAAIAAAERGHEVAVWERAESVGGAVALAASAPLRSPLLGAVAPRLAALERLGVAPVTGREATREAILAESPDLVVIATGAVPRPLSESLGPELAEALARETGLLLFDHRTALAGSPELEAVLWRDGAAIVVYDLDGGFAGGSVAESLGARSSVAEVHLSSPDLFLAQAFARTFALGPLLSRLHQHEVRLRPQRRLVGVRDGALVLQQRFGELQELVEGAAALVVCDFEVPDDRLYRELLGTSLAVVRAGDALAPRHIGAAVLEGRRAVAALDEPPPEARRRLETVAA